ncbi:MAG: MBL fold metallo-hydrolase [Polyangiales bacterium]
MTSTLEAPDIDLDADAHASQPRRLKLLDVEPPRGGRAVELAPGVRWCRIPMPTALDHINVWLIEHDGGTMVVDTGMAVGAGRETWEQIERQVLVNAPLRGVFLTHIHPDHVGLAGWLQQRHHVPVLMSKRTHEQLAMLIAGDTDDAANNTDTADEGARFLMRHGASEERVRPLLEPGRFARMTTGLPEPTQHVKDVEPLRWGARTWTALETNGHAEGHLCLFAQPGDLLISGDQVLPTISSNIGLTWRSQDKNPLGSFLASLDRLQQLPADTLVLPSHGVPFRGLQARIDVLRSHHLEKLDLVASACNTPKTAGELLPVMYRRPLDGIHYLLAMNEALSHLEYLVSQHRLTCQIDATGTHRYAAPS